MKTTSKEHRRKMSTDWRNNSFSVLSNDSGQFTDNGDFHDFYGHTDRCRQNSGAFKSRFISYDQQRLQGIAVKGVFLQNLNPVTIDRCIDPVFSTCFNCWQYGHRYYECILPNHHKFCVNCGRMHVLIDYCPRCRHAYFRHVVYGLASINRQKSVPRIDYYLGNNCYKKDVQDDTSQFRTHENSSENDSTSFSGTSVTNSLEDLYYYSSSDESENLIEDVIVDEDETSCEPVSELLSDFLKLLVDMKAWPIEVQNTILLHFATERCHQTQ